MTNPYAPPEAPLQDAPHAPGSPVKAVLAGYAVDIGGSLVVSLVVTVLYTASLANQGMNEAQIAAALAKVPADSGIFLIGTLAGGMLSLAGGFVCARIARRDEYRIGAILAALSAVTGAALSWESHPPVYNVLLAVLTAAFVMLGIHYGKRRR